MKAICVSACEVDRIGIVQPGEEVELPDGLANDKRINLHFVIDKGTIKNPAAKVPDAEQEDAIRRENFEKSLLNATEWMKALNIIIDSGREVPPELMEDGRLTNEERIAMLTDLWIEDFGYTFPTDPTDSKKDGEGEKKGKNNKSEHKEEARAPKRADKTAEDLFANG